MSRLPAPDEQAFLLDCLAMLIRRRGVSTFLEAPFLAPTEEYFPDPWTPDPAGVKRLAERLLAFAGLPDVEVKVAAYSHESKIPNIGKTARVHRWRHENAPVWFVDAEKGEAVFACLLPGLRGDPARLVGLMAHEVAHAWRAVHKLQNRDEALEERLTDLTTIYLGFGIFTVNNTVRYRVWIEDMGAKRATRRALTTEGHLPAQQMCFLLAAQIISRELSCWQTTKVLRLLENNQRGYVKAALKALREPRGALRDRLGLDDAPQIAGSTESTPAREADDVVS